jgi:hypothetical protein
MNVAHEKKRGGLFYILDRRRDFMELQKYQLIIIHKAICRMLRRGTDFSVGLFMYEPPWGKDRGKLSYYI